MFKKAGKAKGNVTKYQFWQHHNKPIELWSSAVIKQKLDYIHNNPVVAGFVTEPTQWKYSSTKNITEEDPAFEIDLIGFLEQLIKGAYCCKAHHGWALAFTLLLTYGRQWGRAILKSRPHFIASDRVYYSL